MLKFVCRPGKCFPFVCTNLAQIFLSNFLPTLTDTFFAITTLSLPSPEVSLDRLYHTSWLRVSFCFFLCLNVHKIEMLVTVSRFRSVLTRFPCYAAPTVSSYVGYNCSITPESKLVVPARPVKIHTGKASFSRIRNTPGLIYFDKTVFIQKLLEDETDAILFCRPRRFGKTLTLSMLECFHAVQFPQFVRHVV